MIAKIPQLQFFRVLGKRQESSGIAQLEFVMVLVVLIPLFMTLLWSGIAGNAFASVTIQARHDAWRERQNAKTVPFDFSKKDQGRISKSAQQPIHFTKLFDNWMTPQSSHVVFGGSWNHPEVDLDLSPNKGLMQTLVVRSGYDKAPNIQGLFSDLSKLGQISGSFSARSLANNLIDNQLKKIKDLLDPSGTILSEARRKMEGASNQSRTDAQDRVKNQGIQIDNDEKRLLSLQTEIPEAKTKLATAKTPEEKERAKIALQRLEEEKTTIQQELPGKRTILQGLKNSPSLKAGNP